MSVSSAEWATLVSLSGFIGLLVLTGVQAHSMVRERTVISIVRSVVPIAAFVISFGIIAVIARLTDPGVPQLAPPPYQFIPQSVANWLVAAGAWFGFLAAYLVLGNLRQIGHG